MSVEEIASYLQESKYIINSNRQSILVNNKLYECFKTPYHYHAAIIKGIYESSFKDKGVQLDKIYLNKIININNSIK